MTLNTLSEPLLPRPQSWDDSVTTGDCSSSASATCNLRSAFELANRDSLSIKITLDSDYSITGDTLVVQSGAVVWIEGSATAMAQIGRQVLISGGCALAEWPVWTA